MHKLLFLTCLALASQAAQAAPIPFMELSNFRVDARPGSYQQVGAGTFFQLYHKSPGAFWFDSLYGDRQDLAPAVLQMVKPTGTATASFDGNALRTTVDHSDDPFAAMASYIYEFSALPGAQLAFSFDWAGKNLARANGANVSSHADMMLYHVDQWGERQWWSGVAMDGLIGKDAASGVFSYAMSNQYQDQQRWTLVASIYTSGVPKAVPAATVPVPATFGLMLAGLAGMGALRRRRA